MDDEDDIPIRNMFEERFDVSNIEDEVEEPNMVIADDEKLFKEGCGCSRNCVSKFLRGIIEESHQAALELKYNCSEHVKHHHLFLMGE